MEQTPRWVWVPLVALAALGVACWMAVHLNAQPRVRHAGAVDVVVGPGLRDIGGVGGGSIRLEVLPGGCVGYDHHGTLMVAVWPSGTQVTGRGAHDLRIDYGGAEYRIGDELVADSDYAGDHLADDDGLADIVGEVSHQCADMPYDAIEPRR